MELTVLDRLLLLSILPKEGDAISLRIVRKLREDLSFSEEEHKALGFAKTDAGLSWNPEGNIPKDISIGLKARALVVESLEKLNKDKKLTTDFLPLYDLFVEPETN